MDRNIYDKLYHVIGMRLERASTSAGRPPYSPCVEAPACCAAASWTLPMKKSEYLSLHCSAHFKISVYFHYWNTLSLLALTHTTHPRGDMCCQLCPLFRHQATMTGTLTFEKPPRKSDPNRSFLFLNLNLFPDKVLNVLGRVRNYNLND